MGIERVAVLLLMTLALAPLGRGAYLSDVVANYSTGVATYNQTIAAGNASWSLVHLDSGATPAGQTATPFTNSVGLAAAYGNTYGNLTGNFSWTVWLNVSIAVGNNTTWISETKSSPFTIVGPRAPAATPPPPPPPAAGNLTLYLSTPEFGVVYSEVLPVIAYVSAANGTTISEVRAAIENAPPRAAVPGGTACDALPTGWRVMAGGNGSQFVAQWNVNSSTLPLKPGDYTVYVRAQSVPPLPIAACAVVPSVPIKTAPAAPATAPQTSGPQGNLTVIAISCGEQGKQCAQGINGPLEKSKNHYITVSASAPWAICSADCQRFGASAFPMLFVPKSEGKYCAKSIDPKTDAISGPLKFDDGREACWQTAAAFGGQVRRPPGLATTVPWPIQDAKDIPCSPQVGATIEVPGTDAQGNPTKQIVKSWFLRASNELSAATTQVVCSSLVPVYWRIKGPPGCDLYNRSGFNGVWESRGHASDGYPLPWGPGDVSVDSPRFPILCTGRYSIFILPQDDKPNIDQWVPLGEFQVIERQGWGATEWALLTLGFGLVLFPASMLWLSGRRSMHVLTWKASGSGWQPTEGGGPTGDGKKFKMDHFTARKLTIPDPLDVERGKREPAAIHPEVRVLYSVTRPKPWNRRRDPTTYIDVRGFLRQEFSFVEERMFPFATRYNIRSRAEGGLQKLPIARSPIRGSTARSAADVAEPDTLISGYVLMQREELLNILHDEVLDYLGDKQQKDRAKREALDDAAISERIHGAASAERYIEKRGSVIQGRVTGPGASAVQEPRAPPGGEEY